MRGNSMKHPVAKMHTDKGIITIELFPEYAPNTVNSFIWATKENMYEKRLIRRVVPGFVLQPSYCYFDDKRCDLCWMVSLKQMEFPIR